MQIYIEKVIFDNLIIDYMLLKYSRKIVKRPCKFRWLFLYSALGTVFAVVLPIMPVPATYKTLCKVFFCVFYAYISSGSKHFKENVRYIFVFSFLTFACAGFVYGTNYLFTVKYKINYSFENLSFGSVVFAVYIAIKLCSVVVKTIYRKRFYGEFYRKCVAVNGNEKVNLNGFIDTGNVTLDESNNGIVFCSLKTAQKLMNIKTKFSYIRISTVNGISLLRAFEIDKLILNENGNETVKNNVKFCIVDDKRLNGDFDLILPTAI